MPESTQRHELQSFATKLTEQLQSVLGQEAKEEFFKTPVNVAPLFIRSQIASHYAKATRHTDWHQQAEMILQKAETLSDSLAVLYGEDPAYMHSQDCLTSGECCYSCLICLQASFV